MSNANGTLVSSLFGHSEHVGVDRGLAEYKAGRPVLIAAGGQTLVTLPVEGLDRERLEAFWTLCAPVAPKLIITSRRASAIGLPGTTPMAVELTRAMEADTILALVADVAFDLEVRAQPAGAKATAAIELAKLAQLLPAVLAAEARGGIAAKYDSQMVRIEARAVSQFRKFATQSLRIAGEAQVPLNTGAATRFVVFRDALGDSPVAVIVGEPDLTRPVPVRLHSACLTGDAFGSRRCDCGDQLRLALTALDKAGGGVILYLAQEGRGVGLANKMRAYKLQDEGLDTIDANTTLGFDDDERDYGVAARMLEILGYERVVLLTNNPAKLDGLTSAGVEITGRMPLEAPINADNRRYLAAKAKRAGHRLDHLIDTLSERSETDERVGGLAP